VVIIIKKYRIVLLSSLKDNKILFNNCIKHIYESLFILKKDYPNFETWYYNIVISNIVSKEREILMLYNENILVGLSILKNTKIEKKICTLCILPKFRKMGLGKILLKESLEFLNVDFPVITVSNNKVKEFNPLFKYYGFELSHIHKGFYIKNKDEYVYNGILD
jgi:predicted GNAT family N-acyltransferase